MMRRWSSFHSGIDLFEQTHHQERLDMLTLSRKRKKKQEFPFIPTVCLSSPLRRTHTSTTRPKVASSDATTAVQPVLATVRLLTPIVKSHDKYRKPLNE